MNIVARPARAGSADFVDGRTRLYGIVGHPIEQVRSPETITFELRRRGVNALLIPIHIQPQDFDDVFPNILRISNLDGLIITVPFKARALAYMDRVGPLGEFSKGVSVIGRSADDKWIGEMFDGAGCIAALLQRGVPLAGRRVLLLGVGGAGSAIAAELSRQAPASLHIHDPDSERLADFIARLRATFTDVAITSGLPALSDIDVLVNASPVGMLDDSQSPIAVDAFPPHVAVMDVITDPERTKLLTIAEESGCVTVYGREMFDSQISGACDFMLRTRTSLANEVIIRV